MPTKSENSFIELIKSTYYPFRNSFNFYKYVINSKYVIKWILQKRRHAILNSQLSQRIVKDLNTNGIAFTSLSELFPNENLLEKMKIWIELNEKNLRKKNKKNFLLTYFTREDGVVELDLLNPFLNFYLSNKIFFIVSSYLGYIPQFNYLTVEKTIPIEKDHQSTHSQNWHRDPEEKKTMKVFIYLNDVTAENGPFIYIMKSQPSSKGILSKLAPQKLPYGSYPEVNLIKSRVEDKDMVTALGKAGTVIFCDTAGLHKGGLSYSGERIMATGFYPSKHWSEKTFLEVPKSFDKKQVESLAYQVLRNS